MIKVRNQTQPNTIFKGESNDYGTKRYLSWWFTYETRNRNNMNDVMPK